MVQGAPWGDALQQNDFVAPIKSFWRFTFYSCGRFCVCEGVPGIPWGSQWPGGSHRGLFRWPSRILFTTFKTLKHVQIHEQYKRIQHRFKTSLCESPILLLAWNIHDARVILEASPRGPGGNDPLTKGSAQFVVYIYTYACERKTLVFVSRISTRIICSTLCP